MVNKMQLSEIAGQLCAEVIGGDASFESVSIDSRTLHPKQLYVALNGKRFNGHEFAEQACAAGACALLVSEPVSTAVQLPQLKVADTKIALGQLGRINREASGARLIAVTGSSGKTTVKEMVSAILSEMGNTLATSGNFNNEIGVPLTLLRLEQQHQYGVIELGASAGGEIAYLVSLVEPEVAIITNVARAHLSGFGRLSDVANAKAEILTGITPGGTAVLNADDEHYIKWRLMALSEGSGVVSFSTDPTKIRTHADYYCAGIETGNPAVSTFALITPVGEISVSLKLPGSHNLSNALAAAAATMAIGATIEQVKAGLEKMKPVAGRLISLEGRNGSTVIDDSYNANPGSVKAAIETLATYSGRRILVLGDMGELGEQSETLHREMGRIAAQHKIDAVFTLGEKSRAAYAEYAGIHLGGGGAFDDRDALLNALQPKLKKNTIILVKGSRSAQMEKVVDGLKVKKNNASTEALQQRELAAELS
ncbi:MAG: UDP-N-acetylmuramoyl-tripeptide--D-alanyl-D-alanine ligase [Pseudomonadales bacterium]|nr:UDP-N-acetylmuramoyl-tripeptide--D-alanyl-D-alanine ligase [Pseudomonadales bacterium]